MRIAMIGQKRTGSREGGVEVVVTELARRMAELGHKVTCYDRSGTDVNGNVAPSDSYELDGVRVVPVRTIDAKGMAALSSAWFATRAAVKEQPDIIHYHAEGPCNALPAARRAGIRTVATVHGLDWQRAKWGGLASRVIRRGEECAARQADELIVLSHSVQSYFERTYNRETRLVPNGINPVQPRPAEEIKRRWQLSEGSYVLYLGRIVPEKRPELLVEAFQKLETDKRLVIAGGASDTSGYLAELKALAMRDRRILMAGFVEGDLLAELYSNAYCFVLPSDVEGMPMSLLEAMSYGLPCITSDIPECADVLNGSGTTFPRGDAGALRKMLAALIGDPVKARAMGDAARRRVETEYDWGSVVDETLRIYQEAIH